MRRSSATSEGRSIRQRVKGPTRKDNEYFCKENDAIWQKASEILIVPNREKQGARPGATEKPVVAGHGSHHAAILLAGRGGRRRIGQADGKRKRPEISGLFGQYRMILECAVVGCRESKIQDNRMK